MVDQPDPAEQVQIAAEILSELRAEIPPDPNRRLEEQVHPVSNPSAPVPTDPRPAVFAAALGALLAAHVVADHVIQTDHQAAQKVTSWSAMGGHVGSYTAVQVAALAGLRRFGVRPSWRRTAAAVAWSAATHALLDRRWPVRRVLELTGSPSFARMTTPLHGGYLADQALHHVALAVSAVILAGGRRG